MKRNQEYSAKRKEKRKEPSFRPALPVFEIGRIKR